MHAQAPYAMPASAGQNGCRRPIERRDMTLLDPFEELTNELCIIFAIRILLHLTKPRVPMAIRSQLGLHICTLAPFFVAT